MNQEPDDCIFIGTTIQDKKVCILGHRWRCYNDSSYCGNICPDYRRETRQ